MKKLIYLVILLAFLMTSCKEYTIAEGIGLYDPEKDDSLGIKVELPEEYSLEQLVESADVIAKIVIENLTYVKVIMEEKGALGDIGIYGECNYSEVYYSWTISESAGRETNVYIDYNPQYINVENPGFEEDGEYIVFLRKFYPYEPHVYRNFYDYYLLNDYVTYMQKATLENEELIKELIKMKK